MEGAPLAHPRPQSLAGTVLEAIATYDNTENNMHNPNPKKAVIWGGQTYEEMMVGFFDIAVPATTDKDSFFVRGRK